MDDRYDVIGSQITAATRQSAVDRLLARVGDGGGGYICFVNSHVAVTAREDAAVRNAVNDSFMSLADGRPVYVVGKLAGVNGLEPIPGPDFFETVLALQVEPPLRHYFLGGRPEVLNDLVDTIRQRFPAAEVAGAYSPPFRPISADEWGEVVDAVQATQPDLIWVGLGAPKQELFMNAHWAAFKPAVLLGVGAAFDFVAGSVQRAPVWMRYMGCEWLYRLICEPRRLWKRYLYTNTLFVTHAVAAALLRKRAN